MARSDYTRADPQAGSTIGASRDRVLAVLQAATAPLGITDIAERVGLHPNTVRFHLDGLVDRGLVDRDTESREMPGRPRALYSAAAGSPSAGRRSYRLLAEILTSYLATHTRQPTRAALEAGEAWGRFLTDRPTPFRRVDAAAATEQLVKTLDDIGFQPEAVMAGREKQILLHHCPFRETAVAHREVVCSVHLGLMRGMLDELDAPVAVERLDPFVEPELCVTRLATRPRSGNRRRHRAS